MKDEEIVLIDEKIFLKTIDMFYKSLSTAIKNRVDKLGLTREEVFSNNPKRVTEIIKNKRTKKHPYLIGEREYRWLYRIFLYESSEEINIHVIDNSDYFETVEEYKGDKKTGRNKLVTSQKYVDRNNYDKMLWEHINWDSMYETILEDIQNLDEKYKVYRDFNLSLLDYVPYAIDYADYENGETNPFSNFFMVEPPVYRSVKVDSPFSNELESGEELVFGDEIFNQFEQNKLRAIDWVYKKNKAEIQNTIKERFLKEFSGQKLQKFDRKFDGFLKEIMTEIIEKKVPIKTSFGMQAYDYMTEILNGELLNQSGEFSYTEMKTYKPDDWGLDSDGNFYPDYSDEGELKDEEVDVLSNYLEFAKKHLEGLQKFQLEFEKLNS